MTIKQKFDVVWDEVKESIPSCITHPRDVVGHLSHLRNKSQEHFDVVILNGAHRVIKVKNITKGIANKTIVHPREVFRAAIYSNAVAIIIAHNHPSGELSPSTEDCEITARLKASGELIGIPVLDHVIISQRGYYSFLEEGAF